MATPALRLARYGQQPRAAPDWASAQHVYRPRRPTTTPLYPVVQHHLETFLAQATENDRMGYGVPLWVEKDLRAYLRCGILAHGFARLRCEDCGHERGHDPLTYLAHSSRSHANPGASVHHVIRAAWPRSPPTSRITCCLTFPRPPMGAEPSEAAAGRWIGYS